MLIIFGSNDNNKLCAEGVNPLYILTLVSFDIKSVSTLIKMSGIIDIINKFYMMGYRGSGTTKSSDSFIDFSTGYDVSDIFVSGSRSNSTFYTPGCNVKEYYATGDIVNYNNLL